MGNFSRDTFNKLKHYVGVRLQQGVPIVDADWNEMEDIRKYEVRAFLKWFVGEGVPAENDGFRILPAAGDNDFQIQGGDGSPDGEGRCLVDGWDVINEGTINYTAQALYDNVALAAAWGVDPLAPLTTPAADRTDTVFLDVWEREVDSSEDNEHLVNPAIGIETCVRRKREWVVRVAENASSPPAAPANHAHLELARLARRGGAAAIQAADITDLRLTGLKMISLKDVQQIVADAFGTPYSLDHDGQPNLKVSLRDAINAILRGSLPSTPTLPLATEGELNAGFGAFQDSGGDIWVFWIFSATSPPETVEIRHIRFSPVSGTWDEPVTVTTKASLESLPVVIEDGKGDIWVFWTAEPDDDEVVFYNRYVRASGSWEGDKTLAQTTGFNNEEPVAVADRFGDIWAFWLSDREEVDLIYYSRFRRATGEWDDEVALTKSLGRDRAPFALEDSNGDIWLFWTSESADLFSEDIWCKRYNRQADEWEEENQQITTDVGDDDRSFALEDKAGDIWAFWVSDRSGNNNIWYKRYSRASGSWEAEASQLTTDSQSEVDDFFAFEDSNGDIWVFWFSSFRQNSQIYYKRFSREGGWSPAVGLATGADEDVFPFALEDTAGDVWVFWTQIPPFTGDFETFYNDWKLVYRKLIPTI